MSFNAYSPLLLKKGRVIYGWEPAVAGDKFNPVATTYQLTPQSVNVRGAASVTLSANLELTLLPIVTRTSSTNSPNFTNYDSKGGHFILNVTTVSGSASIVLTVQGHDSVSNSYYDILVSSAITTIGINVLKVYPGIATLSNGAASDLVPRTFRVSVAHATGDSITYSVGCNLIN